MSTATDPQKYEAEYADLKFKDEKEFNAWLKKNAAVKIEFEDSHQDFLEWYLDAGGEVLHCAPFQSQVWNGTLVLMAALEEGECPSIKTKTTGYGSLKHRVKTITKLPAAK